MVCGDFNGHSITWSCDKNTSRRARIVDFITDNNICLLNDGSYTYFHPLIFLFVLQTFVWRLISWLNQIHIVVITHC